MLVLDRVTNPANVGMVLRSATAAGLDGVLLPRRGAPAIDPLVVKASAGVAFRAPVLRASTAEDGCVALRDGGFTVLGLDAAGESLMEAELPRRVALVLGAGYDPAETIRRYAPRVHLLHIKDMTAPSRTPGRIADARSTVVGEGMIDWKSVFEATRRAPIHSIFVEQEDPFSDPPLQALARSAAFLKTLSA